MGGGPGPVLEGRDPADPQEGGKETQVLSAAGELLPLLSGATRELRIDLQPHFKFHSAGEGTDLPGPDASPCGLGVAHPLGLTTASVDGQGNA